ncbi:MAG TPA: hypothetical protein VG778_03200, partial [Blastocatellia bacterium]|nr:hypothetical protein [Blastocatellia bacterium]
MEDERDVRLRRQIEDLVRSRLVLLEQDISRLQREVNESFTTLLERTDVAAALPESDELLSRISAEVTARVDSAGAESARLGADVALLRDAVVELDEQRTQADVLNALVAGAANFAPRVVLFVVKGANALAWAARGFEDPTNNAVRGLSIPLQSDTVLRAALNSQQTFFGLPDEQSENHLIFSRLDGVQPDRVLAVTLRVRSKPAAVLYADSGNAGSVNIEANELLVHTAGVVIELVSLRTRMTEGAGASSASRPSQPAVSGPLPSTPRASGTLSGFSAPLTAPSGPIEPMPAHGSGDLQSAFRQAEAPVESFAPAPVSVAPASTGRTGPLDDEEKLHNDARRFA